MVVHIFGKAMKANALVNIGLSQRIFGVGPKISQQVCAKVGIYPQMRMNELTESQILSINKELNNLTIEGQLKQKINDNIKLKRSIGTYAGTRHALGLPVRGQKTQNNASTARRLNHLNRHV